ncbi:GNAT family N-acetyltransferase [Micromonospora sp. NBC_01638]|uniref:GNAT family N-acetyltransferase n=1 Tax=Micromonospora sp. NBC_01638 TaxID=2975982 RepID=UPI00386F6A6A|nr:GNAT family N-acetyltransferase [Micromonospora sp. NBC_01638]
MKIEIRPITRAEAVDYLKVLPFANGLPNWEPAPAAWHGGPEAWPQPNKPATDQQLECWADEVMADHFHPQAAFVDGKLVGGSAMVSLAITAPGLRPVPLGGVTATGVIATHRRQGLLRGIMQAMFDEALGRGEPLAALSASEGGIYGRFGFSPATMRVRWELERSDAMFIDRKPASGSLELVDAATARLAWPEIHEQIRHRQVGELAPQPDQWAGLTDDPAGSDGSMRYLVHRNPQGKLDGVANFRLPWSPALEHAGTLVVDGFQAVSSDAYRAMWMLLTDFDLTRKVVTPSRPIDEPLRWLLRNPRAMRITRQSDNLWLRILDLPTALAARAYESTADLTIAIDADTMCPGNTGVWHLVVTPEGATCSPTNARPDLTMDIQALGSLYLGGMSAAVLAAAGRIRPHRPGALADITRVFRVDPEPFNSFGF